MAVQWDVSAVPNYHTNFPDVIEGEQAQWNRVTFALVSVMLIIGPLTEKDIDEFWLRLSLYQEKLGPLLGKAGKDGRGEAVFITRKQVEQHLGIKVNISPISKAAFDKNFMNILRREHESAERWEKAKAQTA